MNLQYGDLMSDGRWEYWGDWNRLKSFPLPLCEICGSPKIAAGDLHQLDGAVWQCPDCKSRVCLSPKCNGWHQEGGQYIHRCKRCDAQARELKASSQNAEEESSAFFLDE